jgi:hypothetical protein
MHCIYCIQFYCHYFQTRVISKDNRWHVFLCLLFLLGYLLLLLFLLCYDTLRNKRAVGLRTRKIEYKQ